MHTRLERLAIATKDEAFERTLPHNICIQGIPEQYHKIPAIVGQIEHERQRKAILLSNVMGKLNRRTFERPGGGSDRPICNTIKNTTPRNMKSCTWVRLITGRKATWTGTKRNIRSMMTRTNTHSTDSSTSLFRCQYTYPPMMTAPRL